MALLAAAGSAAQVLLGCSTTPSVNGTRDTQRNSWSGRLAIQIQASSPSDANEQSFSASFELDGSPASGSLHLYTPLGSSAARMTWSDSGARLEQGGQTRDATSLQALVRDTLGTDIPIAAMFAWLQGQPQNVDGWTVDLKCYADGYVTAVRNSPLPHTRLLLILDR